MTSSGTGEYANVDRATATSVSNSSSSTCNCVCGSERAIAASIACTPISSPFWEFMVAMILSVNSVMSGLRDLFVWKQKATTDAPDTHNA